MQIDVGGSTTTVPNRRATLPFEYLPAAHVEHCAIPVSGAPFPGAQTLVNRVNQTIDRGIRIDAGIMPEGVMSVKHNIQHKKNN